MSTIILTLDGATMTRHTTDPDLADLYAAGWVQAPSPGAAVVDAAFVLADVSGTGNQTAITVATRLLLDAVAEARRTESEVTA